MIGTACTACCETQEVCGTDGTWNIDNIQALESTWVFYCIYIVCNTASQCSWRQKCGLMVEETYKAFFSKDFKKHDDFFVYKMVLFGQQFFFWSKIVSPLSG